MQDLIALFMEGLDFKKVQSLPTERGTRIANCIHVIGGKAVFVAPKEGQDIETLMDRLHGMRTKQQQEKGGDHAKHTIKRK